MLKSMSQWANDAAVFVQGACNLSGVVFSFERLTNDLREVNELRPDHPFVILWVDKMDDLSRSKNIDSDDRSLSFDDAIVSLIAIMRRICDDETVKGTDERNQHPDIQNAIARLALLTGNRDVVTFGNAYEECEKMMKAA